MAARGDMGIETCLETVPIKQNLISRKCVMAAKPFIVATQMLESMVENPRATRAEVNDVYSAVVNGASCVMLSGESAKGKFPLRAVQTMANVEISVQRNLCSLMHMKLATYGDTLSYLNCKHPAVDLALAVKARFLICFEAGNLFPDQI